jgi:hypothetical protein
MKKKPTKSETGAVMRKVRKPVPPPSRVEEDLKRYHRERERERVRREETQTEDSSKR